MGLQRKGFSMCLISGRVGNTKDRTSTVKEEGGMR